MKLTPPGEFSFRGSPLSFMSSPSKKKNKRARTPSNETFDEYLLRLADEEADHFNMLHEQEEPNV